MDFLNHMLVYFNSEKTLGVLSIPMGAGVLILSGFVWYSHRDALASGMIVPLAIFGIVAVAGGTLLVHRTDKQMEQLTQLFQEDKRAFVEQELPRMEKVNANWPRLKVAYAIVVIVSLAVLFFVNKEWFTGLAMALILMSAILLIVDVFAEKRAVIYTEYIRLINTSN
ncbi:hypothetical protein ACFL2Q_05905 [Thermodesulfobacteriota bacterium]